MVFRMFAHGVRDILKPAWVLLIEQCKLHGARSIPDLIASLELSYMGVKQQCETLVKLGYRERHRVARTKVGRPEISYRLTSKSNVLFPQAGVQFTLELLRQFKPMFGDKAAEKLLSHYFDEKKLSFFLASNARNH
jgi:predicted ArsR family transcriptional regulator